MELEFKHMSEIAPSEHVALNTNPLVMRQMLLSDDNFDEEFYKEWIKGREKLSLQAEPPLAAFMY